MKALRPYAFAALIIATTLLLTLGIAPVQQKSPYLLLTLGVMLSARSGFWPGVFATLLGAVSGDYFLIPPLYTFPLFGPTEDLVPLFLFCAVGIAISWVSHRLLTSNERIRAANQTLTEAHRRTTTILESISDGFNVFDREWRYIYVNAAGAGMVRKKPEELLGKNVWELWPAAADSPFGSAYRRAVEENVPVQVEAFYPEPLNAWFQVRCYPSGEGLTLFFTDVTERKRAEGERQRLTQDLADRLGELQAVLDSAPVAIWIAHDPLCLRITGNAFADQVVMQVSRGGNVSLSAGRDDVAVSHKVFRKGVELTPGELPAQIATATGKPVPEQELELVFSDGRVVPMLMGAVPLFDAGGNVRGAVVAGADLTEIRSAEERLRRAQKLESIGLLAGGIAHDFNNLLVGVIGNASLARSFLSADHTAAELLDKVVKAGEQAAHLTRQMLAYAGKGRFVLELLDLSDLVPEMSGLVEPSIPKKIALHLKLAPHLPPIQADRGQMQQVFMNLVLNAAEAIGSNAGLISVRTGVQDVEDAYILRHPEALDLHPGRYVYLEVRDSGCGMDEATKARIFDPFFSTKFAGRGLGLAAVTGIARGHKGAITVESTPGQGTCFTVLFPAAEGIAAAARVAANNATLRGAGTVLVVDDEEIVRELAKTVLERYGYTVLVAGSGLEAIDLFKREPRQISLVILDASMPGMGGEETLPELLKIRPNVKVAISSGYTESETLRLFTGLQIPGFLQKPYTSNLLAEKVKSMLG